MTPLQQRTLQVAKRYVGVVETATNDSPQIRVWQRFIAFGASWLDRQPWCACFAVWCVHRAAKEIGVTTRIPRTASSSALFRWGKSHGQLLAAPESGCIGLVKGGPTGHSHTFLVHDVREGKLIGVEGNYRNRVGWTSHRPVSTCDYVRIS